MAAWIVHRPSPESETRPEKSARSGLSQQGLGRQVEQPRGDDASAPPDLGDVGEVQVVLVEFGMAQGGGLGVNVLLMFADVRRA